jgi:uncharacterized protein YqkB
MERSYEKQIKDQIQYDTESNGYKVSGIFTSIKEDVRKPTRNLLTMNMSKTEMESLYLLIRMRITTR